MYDGAAFASCGRKTEVTAHTDERLSNGRSSPSSSAAEIVGVGADERGEDDAAEEQGESKDSQDSEASDGD